MVSKINNTFSAEKVEIIDFSKNKLRVIVSYYLLRVSRLQTALQETPGDWGKYQKLFNNEVNHLFKQIISFEKKCIHRGDAATLERVKSFFGRRFGKHFYYGDLSRWSIDKPFGYAGDFRVIDAIYENQPRTTGYCRLFDNYFQMSAIAVAVRNRKEDFKRKILNFVERNSEREVRIMNLASGPCREIYELYHEHPDLMAKVSFDCFDSEKKAHRYAMHLLGGVGKVNFIIENALKVALSKDVSKKVVSKYDFIYSMGLYDYLNFDLSVRLTRNLRDRLKEGGELHVADVRDRYYNPSVLYMEWAGDWNLLYRTDEEFFRIFMEAGFSPFKLSHSYEQQGVVQYIGAKK
ncbi:MAG: hypothetical protein HQL19_03555 [Candidatus Omnitrophica bacterium]|nr:hypothetical protein [Candidatus Omnitrophota bacterium]